MIDFPNNPTNGSTYSYQGIKYTFHKPTTAEGYWRVTTPTTLGVATPTEINEGTDNAKYVTPMGLDSSEYVREDKTSGETVLNSSGSERLKTVGTGVEVTGNLDFSGNLVYSGDIVPIVIEQDFIDSSTTWRKWSDGTLECWGKSPTLAGPRQVYYGQTFIALPVLLVSGTNAAYAATYTEEVDSFISALYRSGSGVYSGSITYYARGRWK